MKAKEMIEKAKAEGCIEIAAGVYLWTQAEIREDAEGWDDDDPSKKTDFSVAPYWVTDDAGMTPVAIHSPEDLEAFLDA